MGRIVFVDCKGSREILNAVLEETNSHLTQSFTIPWYNTPTYALSSYFSFLPPSFIYLPLFHPLCLQLIHWSSVGINWMSEPDCLSESTVQLIPCPYRSTLASLYFLSLPFPPGRQISLYPLRCTKHDNRIHPSTHQSPSSCHTPHSHEPRVSLHHLPWLCPPPLPCLSRSPRFQQLPPAAHEPYLA